MLVLEGAVERAGAERKATALRRRDRFKVQRDACAQGHGYCHDGPESGRPPGERGSKQQGRWNWEQRGPRPVPGCDCMQMGPFRCRKREWGTDRVPTSGMALPAPPGFLESSRCRGQPGYCGFSGETKAQCLRGPQARCLLWVPLSGSRSAFAPVWDPDGAEEESGVHSGGVGALTSGRPSDGRPLSAESGVGARGGPCSG